MPESSAWSRVLGIFIQQSVPSSDRRLSWPFSRLTADSSLPVHASTVMGPRAEARVSFTSFAILLGGRKGNDIDGLLRLRGTANYEPGA